MISWLQDCKYLFPLKEDSLTWSSFTLHSREVMKNIRKTNLLDPSAILYFKCFLILCGVNTSICFTLFSLWSFHAHLKPKYLFLLHQWSLLATLHNCHPGMVSLPVNVITCSLLILQQNIQKCWCTLNSYTGINSLLRQWRWFLKKLLFRSILASMEYLLNHKRIHFPKA